MESGADDPHDYVRAVFAHFVALRGRGTDLSAIDEQLLLRWEAAGLPLAWVIEGIDAAFAKLREPPASLSDCTRYVNKVAKAHRTEHAADPAQSPVSAFPAAPPVANGGASEDSDEPASIRRLRRLATGDDPLLGPACAFVLDALIALGPLADLPPDELASIDDRVEAALWERLTDADRARLDDKALQAAAAQGRGGDARAERRARSRAVRDHAGYRSVLTPD